MPYLPNLIKKIDDFARLASALESLKRIAAGPDDAEFDEAEPDYSQYNDPRYQKVTNEDDEEGSGETSGPGLYSNIINIAASINKTNEDAANELVLIATLYKKALELNGGYSYVKELLKKAFGAITDFVGEDGTDEETGDNPIIDDAENILNAVSADLTERMKTSPGQMDSMQAEKELKVAKKAFNAEEAGAMMTAQKSVFEKGKPGAETGHNIGPMGPAETPQQYALEIKRLKDGLDNDRSISLNVAPSEKSINQNIRNNMQSLIDVLVQLIKQLPLVLELEAKVKESPDDAETKETFIKAAETLSTLRGQRRDLKQAINKYLMTKDLEGLESQYVRARDPKQKAWIEDQIRLQRVRMSSDYNKKQEIKARRALIAATGTLDENENFISLNPPPEMIQRLQDAITAGAAQKVSKVKYDEIQSRERAKQHGQIGEFQARRKGRRGGGSPRARLHQYDIGAASFHGLVDKLGEKINTATHVSRLAVTQINEKGRAKTHNELKPYVDALSKAIQKKNNPAKYEAIKKLKEQLVDWSSKEPAIKALEKNVRLLPYFKKYESELDLISKWKKPDEPWNLDEAQRSYIKSVLESWDKLINIYRRYYQGVNAPKTSFYGNLISQMDLNFSNAIQYISAVLNRLEYETDVYASRGEPEEQLRVEPEEKLRVQPGEPEYLEEGEESGPQKRMKNLTQLLEK